MTSRSVKTNRLIRQFGILKVPLIWYCRPKVIEHTDEKIEIKIALKRRTRNHLGSMYFGVLAVGADITGGFLACRVGGAQGILGELGPGGWHRARQ